MEFLILNINSKTEILYYPFFFEKHEILKMHDFI